MQNIQRIVKYARAHKAHSAIAEKILLLNKCLMISVDARPKHIKINALNPCGVLAVVSMKIPTTRPVSAPRVSEQKMQTDTSKASGNIGFALTIFRLKELLY